MDIIDKRLQIVKTALEIGIVKAADLYGYDRKTVSGWLKKFKKDGANGLLQKSQKQDRNHIATIKNSVDQTPKLKQQCNVFFLLLRKCDVQNYPFQINLIRQDNNLNIIGFIEDKSIYSITAFLNSFASNSEHKKSIIYHNLPFLNNKEIILKTKSDVTVTAIPSAMNDELRSIPVFLKDKSAFQANVDFSDKIISYAQLLIFNYSKLKSNDEFKKHNYLYPYYYDHLDFKQSYIAEVISYLLNYSLYLQNLRKLEETVQTFNLIILLADIIENSSQKIDAMTKKAQILNKLNLGNEAFKTYANAAKLADETKNYPLLTKVYGLMGIYLQQTNNRKAGKYLSEQLRLAKEHNLFEEICYACQSLGVLNNSLGHSQKALEYYQQVIEISRQTGQKACRLTALGNIGVIYLRKNRIKDALEYYKAALNMAEEIGNKRQIARMLINIGVAHAELNDSETARINYLKALDLSRELNVLQFQASILSNLGSDYLTMNETGKAMEVLREALFIFEKLDDKENIAVSLGEIAAVYKKINKPVQSKNTFLKAIIICEEIDEKYNLSWFYLMLASILFDLNKIDQAYDKIQLAKSTADSAERTDIYLELALNEIKINKIKNHEDAQFVLNNYLKLLKSTASREHKSEIIINLLEYAALAVLPSDKLEYVRYSQKVFKDFYKKTRNPIYSEKIEKLHFLAQNG